jgi:putative restriction endonuclease
MVAAQDPDTRLRQAALEKARDLSRIFDDVVPLPVLREGFQYGGRRISFGSFQRGIHRSREQAGPAALTLTTAPPKPGGEARYDDLFDEDSGTVIYHYRSGAPDQPDNLSLRAARELMTPLIYFKGISPGQYMIFSPVFVTQDDPGAGLVLLEFGLPYQDTRGEGLTSSEDARRYEFSLVRRRYHQVRFRRDVLDAYGNRCAVCSLREVDLLEASHIVRDSDDLGIAAVVSGLALCAIHHRAYDRNLLGIDPRGVVHIGGRLLREIDGPMLGNGIQHFHGASILQPARSSDRPDPERLALRFEEFQELAA